MIKWPSKMLTIPIKLGVSACLLGQNVRYDGKNKRYPLLKNLFDREIVWIPVCPEVELGLGTPRSRIRLEKVQDSVRLVMPATGEDLTDAMENYARRRVSELRAENICGFVFKSSSPSCGMRRVPIYSGELAHNEEGAGAFVRVLIEQWANLPIEEESGLMEPNLQKSFVEKVLAGSRAFV
ncbi:MAG: DUF523 domain-containing protein [Pseudomonadota bacterium]